MLDGPCSSVSTRSANDQASQKVKIPKSRQPTSPGPRSQTGDPRKQQIHTVLGGTLKYPPTTPGVKQDDCAVFRVNQYGGDVNRAYRAAVGHILTSRANRPLGDRGESCPICFGFHTLVGQACISPFIDWNAMIVSSHPLCPMCRGLHHAGYDCVNIK